MKLLLDTHTFIWWSSNSIRLSPHARSLILDPGNTLLLSAVSAWEMIIKLQLGKLTLSVPLDDMIERHQQANSMQILPVILPHVLALGSLPPHHRDPFDRMLIAQANAENAALVSHDPTFSQYRVDVRW